eukprot:scaffold118822_cov49-Attheya_sp.AAC.3
MPSAVLTGFQSLAAHFTSMQFPGASTQCPSGSLPLGSATSSVATALDAEAMDLAMCSST